jgi:hypothetical protein
MWINLRFNVSDTQLVVLPREERRWITPRGQRFVDTEPDHYRNGCFRMTVDQFKWYGVKCGACAVEKIKSEPSLSSVQWLLEPVN